MRDNYDRTIDYIRISVTDRCNLRCAYCMPKNGVESIPHSEILKLEEILRLCKIFASLGTKKVKVTGGEPLVRGGVVGFISELKKIRSIEKVTLTTNGVLLEKNLPALIEAGIDGINISLDTLNSQVYRALTGSDECEKIMSAIAACSKKVPVKLNCVPICGVNESELVDIAALARETVLAVRFIELMPIGLGAEHNRITAEKIKRRIETAYGPLKPCSEKLGNGPARYYSIDGFSGCIGMINALSHEFCAKCNRIRLTSDGWLKLCLAYNKELSLKDAMRGGASDTELAKIISEAVKHKPQMHRFNMAAYNVKMNSIGG